MDWVNIAALLVLASWWIAGARRLMLGYEIESFGRRIVVGILYVSGMLFIIYGFIDLWAFIGLFLSNVFIAAMMVVSIATFVIFLYMESLNFLSGEGGSWRSPRRQRDMNRTLREAELQMNRARERLRRQRNLSQSILSRENTDARQEAWEAIEEMENKVPQNEQPEDLSETDERRKWEDLI